MKGINFLIKISGHGNFLFSLKIAENGFLQNKMSHQDFWTQRAIVLPKNAKHLLKKNYDNIIQQHCKIFRVKYV